MNLMLPRPMAAVAAALLAAASPAQVQADQLYTGNSWANVAADDKARAVGDIVTVLIFEAASASNRVESRSGRETTLSGGISAGSLGEDAALRLRGGYAGSGEVERSDRLAAIMAAQVVELAANGDLLIEGRQSIEVNGEVRLIAVRGQIRRVDIAPDNTVASSRLANAQINYDGKGFVSRSAKPGLINRIFSFLGLG
jgi:flagellar L-ring protein precursor FlgH